MAYSSNLFHFTCRIIYFSSYLGGRTFTVYMNDTTSTPKSTPSGIPQGTVLSTTLFSLYLSDMPRPPHTHLALDAFDTVLLSQSWWPDTISHRITNAVMTLCKLLHFVETPIKFPQNWNHFIFQAPSPHPNPNQIQDNVLPWASAVRYLGLC